MRFNRIEMNYLRVYCNLIRKAEKRGYTKKKAKEQEMYVEGHHTFPVSIFGKNKRIVYLTAREHYIAHALLEKIYLKRYGICDDRTKKMIYAFWGMCMRNKEKEKINSYLFENLKILRSNVLKSLNGENHYNYGKKRSLETKEKLRKSRIGKKATEETKKKLSEMRKGNNHHFYGKHHTEEVKQKMSKNRKGKGLYSDSMKKEMSERMKIISPFKGKKHTEETLQKMRGRKVNENTRQKLSELNCKLECQLISPEGNIFFTKNLSQFCKKSNLVYTAMHMVVSGKRKNHKGWSGFIINKEKR